MQSNVTRPTVCLISLGCPKSQVDSEILSVALRREGFRFAADPAEAEVIIVNTCGFIREAVEESLSVLRSLRPYRLEGGCRFLVAAGCLVQRYGRSLRRRLPEVDLFLGTEAVPEAGVILSRVLHARGRRVFFIPPFAPAVDTGRLFEERPALGASAYLKIAEGCSNACAFCTLPRIRGPLRSRPEEEILTEAAHLCRQGVKELNLIAQDLTAYGRERGPRGRRALAGLLERMEEVEGVRWIRLLYCHPAHLDDALLDLFRKGRRLCPYLDLPIQHASTPLLRRMGRPYGEADLRSLVERLREARPDIALRTTVMVGFPGETEEDVERLLRFLEETRFHHLGVFCYSPERGTAAYRRRDSVPPAEKERRRDAVMELQAGISKGILRGLIGTEQEVLLEGPAEEDPAFLTARTAYQAPEVDGVVFVPAGDLVAEEGMATVRVTRAGVYDLEGEILRQEGG